MHNTTRLFIRLLALLALAAVGCAQDVRSTLTGLRVGEQAIAFDTPLRVVTKHFKADRAKWADPRDSIWLRVTSINGIDLPAASQVRLRTAKVALGKVEHGSRWQLQGQVKDALDFGGETQFSMTTTSAKQLPAGPLAAEKSEPKGLAVAGVEIGRMAKLQGTLWSRNGEWWFDAGEEVLLADARGRQRRFPTNWHGHKVTVRGLAKRQLRGPLRQGSSSDADDALRSYLVLFDAKVELAAGDAKAADAHEDNRFRTLYDDGPRLVAGVFDLLPVWPPVRNASGDRTAALMFAIRNWPHLEQTVREATPAQLDVVAARVNDTKRHRAMRAIYAGVLAANDDVRGRNYLAARLAMTDRDALQVVGAFDQWVEQKKCERRWAEAPLLRCLKAAPVEVLTYSGACDLLVRMRSAPGIQQMFELYLTPEKIAKGGEDWMMTSPEDRLLWSLSSVDSEMLTDDMLAKMARSRPADHAHQRRIAKKLLERDAVVAVDLFLNRIAEDFWYATFRDHAGKEVLAEIRRRLPTLAPAQTFEVEMLLAHHSLDAVDKLIARMQAQSTPAKQLSRLCWELGHVDGGSKGAVAAARFLKKRVTENQRPVEVDGFQIQSVLRFVGTSSDLAAVTAMVDLLEADFSRVATEYVSAKGMRNCVAAQLAEMTGESFGVDAKAWRTWIETK